jgi:hypothetical protein
MDIEQVRGTLRRMLDGPAGSVTALAQEIRVPHMTLRRFVSGETVEPQAEAWERMRAYVVGLQPPTADEARGMLRVVNRLRQELDTIEAQARSAIGGRSDEDDIGDLLGRALPTPPVPAAPLASARPARRRAKG